MARGDTSVVLVLVDACTTVPSEEASEELALRVSPARLAWLKNEKMDKCEDKATSAQTGRVK